MESHIEAAGIERRKSALNGDDRRWMGRRFVPWRDLRTRDVVASGDVIEDELHDDDSDVNAAVDFGEKLVDEIVDGIEGVAGEDAGDGGGGIGMNAGNVKVGKLGADGVVQQGGVVGHRLAGVAARDDGAGDGIDDAPGNAVLGSAEVARVLMGEDWNGKG